MRGTYPYLGVQVIREDIKKEMDSVGILENKEILVQVPKMAFPALSNTVPT